MLITNGTVVTWENPNRILTGHAVYIENGLIADIGPTNELVQKYSHSERIDARGQFVMPGNICAHTHFYGAYARGMAIHGSAPKDFPEILEKLWWPLDQSLTPEAVRYSALVCLIDAIKHGTTTLIDHHASPNTIQGSLDEIAAAVELTGVRASLCYEVTDRGGENKALAGIAENVRFIERCKQNNLGGRLAASFGLHASLTLSEKTLSACRNAVPDDIGFHIHVAEHPVDEYDSVAKTGLRVVDRLHKHGILGPKTIVVHAVHIDAKEIALLAETNTWVTHQPRSNMNNAVGMSEVESMLRAGIKVCVGNDGFSNTMWEEWKFIYLGHKLWHLDPRRMSGTDVVKMAVYNNAELASKHFVTSPIGVIQKGAVADIIFVDYHPYTPVTVDNLPWHIIFGFHESMVTMTMVAGKILMKDRQILTIDEDKVTWEAQQIAPVVWERYQQQF